MSEKNTKTAASDFRPDLICLGRAGVDFYAEQIGSRLEDVASFAKYIGGSSTNIACCSSRMGLKTALITRVGNEHMGQFIREQLEREGVDTRLVKTDPDRLTALVVLGIKDQDTFPLIFFRENCADMAISEDDLDASFIAKSKALLITGTHLSTTQVYNTSKAALRMAREAGVKTVLDIDYRPVLWGLTTRGDGETRFVASDNVTEHLLSVLGDFDLVVGTEEEIHIAGGSTDTLQALRTIRERTDAILVLKRGPFGASVYEAEIPVSLDDGVTVAGVTVDVLNVLGAGDAFISGFLRGWINGEGFELALTYANACGALVVSRHGCTPAMPTRDELDYFLNNANNIVRPDIDPMLNYLHRVTTRSTDWPELYLHAFDHRIQLEDMCTQAGKSTTLIPRLKDLLLAATLKVIESRNLRGRGGILCDGRFGQSALNTATGQGLWIGRPVEWPKAVPLAFEHGDSIGTIVKSWPTEHVVKCLIFYSVEDNAHLKALQEQRILELYRASAASSHELLLEIIPPAEELSVGESLCRSVERFYDLSVHPDWWKLPCMDADSAKQLTSVVSSRSPYCRGIVVLGLDAPIAELGQGFKAFAGLDLVRGFAVGRSIFGEPARAWLQDTLDDASLIQQVADNYCQVLDQWERRHQA